jgi:hypothetical protein
LVAEQSGAGPAGADQANGSYGAITPEAWIEYEIAMTVWQARYRERHKGPG